MNTSYTFIRRYIKLLNDVKTTSVLGFNSTVALAAAIPTTSTISKLISKNCHDDTTICNTVLAFINVIHARICISLGIHNFSKTSEEVFTDVFKEVTSPSYFKRSFMISFIIASITAVGAFVYYTLIAPLQSTSELTLSIICQFLLILITSLVVCTLIIQTSITVIRLDSCDKPIRVHPYSPGFRLLRLFSKSVNNPDNLAFNYAIKNIANKVSLKYRIPHIHSMSESIDGIPDQDIFYYKRPSDNPIIQRAVS